MPSAPKRALPQMPAAPWSVFRHAPFIAVYGPSGAGKDADMIKAWPDAYIFGFRGSESSWSTWGPEMAPDSDQLLLPFFEKKGLRPSMRTASMLLGAIRKKQLPWRPALLISDLSLMADVDLEEVELEYGENGWEKWGAVLKRARVLRDQARALNIVVAVNGHDAGCRGAPMDSNYVKGGLKLGSHNGRAEFHKLTDMNLHIVPDDSVPAWPNGYQVTPSVDWFEKDRFNKIRGVQPMNLREALISGPTALWVPRRLGLEWCDAEADKVVALCQAGADPADAAAEVEQALLTAGRDPGIAYMAAYDGMCRYFYQKPQSTRFTRPTTDLFAPAATEAAKAEAPTAEAGADAAVTKPLISTAPAVDDSIFG